MKFRDFVAEVVKDTAHHGWISWLWKTKVTNLVELKSILLKLMTVIKNVMVKKVETHDVFEFIDTEFGYNVSNKDSINFLNFLINYKFYDSFDTVQMLRSVYPELAEKVGEKKEEPMNIIDIPDKTKKIRNYSQKNQGYPKKFEGKPFEGKPFPKPEGGEGGGGGDKKPYSFKPKKFEGNPFPKPEGGEGGGGDKKPFSPKPKPFPPKQRKTRRRARA